jgi:aldehyde:ferredoxin oxidoreductase
VYGWSGRILVVDLSDGKIEKRDLDKNFARAFLGGRGFNSKFIYDIFNPTITNPFDPENIICISPGLLSGTLAPSSSRVEVSVARSPVHGVFCDGNAGGSFGPELRMAGYDSIIITGKSKSPVYIQVLDDEVMLKDASHVWGKNVWETIDVLREEVGDPEASVLTIGPAGENLVASACVITDYTRAATGGSGAVFGSKNLKAIVVRGTKGIKLARPEEFEKVAIEIHEKMREGLFYERLSKYGTTMLVSIFGYTGVLPTRNWQTGVFPEWEEISGDALIQKYVVKSKGCFGCPIHCSRIYAVREGPFAGTVGEGPEYEELSGFGSKCGISSLPALLYINNLLNQLGLDVVQTSNYVSCAMHWWQDGIISSEDTDGLILEWGNYNAVIELIKNIAFRKGFGNILADGILVAARKIANLKGLSAQKLEYYVIHTKGMTHSNVELRASTGLALAYGTATRGGDHLRGHATPERYASLGLYTKPEDWTRVGVPLEEAKRWYEHGCLDPSSYNKKGIVVKWLEDLFAAVDSLGICKFTTPWQNMPFGPEYMARLVTAATGVEYTWRDIMTCGERIYNVEKAIQVRYGLRRKDDYLPERLYREPLPEGPRKGAVLDKEKYGKMLDEYYEERGWDVQTSIPKKETLIRLGLHDVAEDLEKRGILR